MISGKGVIRTVISLDENDKAWLDQQAALRHVPMAEVVRQALRAYRASCPQGDEDFDALLVSTSGAWVHGDGLIWQNSLRNEWER